MPGNYALHMPAEGKTVGLVAGPQVAAKSNEVGPGGAYKKIVLNSIGAVLVRAYHVQEQQVRHTIGNIAGAWHPRHDELCPVNNFIGHGIQARNGNERIRAWGALDIHPVIITRTVGSIS